MGVIPGCRLVVIVCLFSLFPTIVIRHRRPTEPSIPTASRPARRGGDVRCRTTSDGYGAGAAQSVLQDMLASQEASACSSLPLAACVPMLRKYAVVDVGLDSTPATQAANPTWSHQPMRNRSGAGDANRRRVAVANRASVRSPVDRPRHSHMLFPR
ncbi:hypothetical protein RJ55_08484 [Drechmeria coniospora]|nr:hypothetical protein RJ55_08484 [Drechmeria coniospora]